MDMTRIKNMKVLTVLTVTYCILFVIAALFQFFVTTNTLRTLRANEDERNRLILGQYRMQVDSIFNAISGIDAGLKQSENLAGIPFWNDEGKDMAYAGLRDEIYNVCMLYSAYIEDIYLYNSRDDAVVSYAGKESIEVFQASGHGHYADILTSQDAARISRVYQAAQGDAYLYYFSQIRLNGAGNFTNAMYVIRLDILNQWIYTSGIDCHFGIYSENGYIGSDEVMRSLRDEVVALSARGLNTITKVEHPGREQIYAVASEMQPLVYIVNVEEPDVSGIIGEFSRRVVWISAIFVVIMVLLIGSMVRFQYLPVKELMHNIGVSQEKSGNEYEAIRRYVDAVRADYRAQQAQLRSHSAHVRNWFLLQLITNRYLTQAHIDEMLSSLDMDLSAPDFLVANIEVFDKENAHIGGGTGCGAMQEDYQLRVFAVENIAKSVLATECRAETVENSGTIVCILNFDGKSLRANALIEKMRETQKAIVTRLGVGCKVFIGSVEQGIRGIERSYRCAMDSVRYKERFRLDNVLVYDDIINAQDSRYQDIYNEKVSYRLTLSLKTGDTRAVGNMIASLGERMLSESWMFKRHLLNDLFNVIHDTCEEMKAQSSELEQMLDGFMWKTHDETMFEKDMGILTQAGMLLTELIRNTEISSMETMILDVKRYVEENFQDENLNVTMISKVFKISTNYLSTLFSGYVGTGLHDYITSVRMARARAMLAENQDLKIKEVAEAVGYANVRTFNRVFAAESGLSPTKYRDELKKTSEA